MCTVTINSEFHESVKNIVQEKGKNAEFYICGIVSK